MDRSGQIKRLLKRRTRRSKEKGGRERSLEGPGMNQAGLGDLASRTQSAFPRIRLAGLEAESVVDGPGLRFTVFVQGCPHHCPGCQNPETHPSYGGRVVTVEDLFRRYQANPLLDGMTLSGGEPFGQASSLVPLAQKVQASGGSVVTYTGYPYESLLSKAKTDPATGLLLDATDLLVDGPFVEARKSLTLTFRGSSNQRFIPLSVRGMELLRKIQRT